MIDGLLAALDALGAHKGLRAVVLKGNGKHFQAGADLKWINAVRKCVAGGKPARLARDRRSGAAAQHGAGADRRAGAWRLLRRRHRHDRGVRRGARRRQCDVLDRRGALGPARLDHHPAARRRDRRAAVAPLCADRRALRRRGGLSASGSRTRSCRSPSSRAEGARIVEHLLANGPDAIAETKAWVLRSAWSDLDEKEFAALVESHAAKRQSAEAAEGLASFAEKRAGRWRQGLTAARSVLGLQKKSHGNADAPHRSPRRLAHLRHARGARRGRAGGELRHRAIRVPVHRRAVRLRQVDPAQSDRGLPHADRRRDPHRRQAGERPRARPRRGVPGFRAAVPVAHRARQRHLRAGDEGRRRRPSARRSRATSLRWSSWRSSPTPIRTISPAACSSASRSRARLPTIRPCC